ncbi:hypothetical protein ALT1644_620005 [Alteromonas macleodii]
MACRAALHHGINRTPGVLGGIVPLDDHKAFRIDMPTQQTDQSGGNDYDRERHGKEEDRHESGDRQCVHVGVLEDALADADHRLDHDRQHGRLDTEKQGLHQ